MDLALIHYGTKDVDSTLACLMFAFVAICASIVIFLWCRHAHHCRKKKKHAQKHAPHAAHGRRPPHARQG